MPWQMIKKALLLEGAIQLPIIEINSEYLNTKEIVKKTLKTDQDIDSIELVSRDWLST
jgi:hypothetical protein|tara:strand:+ start:489 stop:662 length:174 start_codon:yes stop_codon:yes gene_type:complete